MSHEPRFILAIIWDRERGYFFPITRGFAAFLFSAAHGRPSVWLIVFDPVSAVHIVPLATCIVHVSRRAKLVWSFSTNDFKTVKLVAHTDRLQ
jgi:hypothetical protein